MNNQVFEEMKLFVKDYNIVFSDENNIDGCKQEFSDEVNWWNVSIDQKLSEEFIREFANKVEWILISRYQKLSESCIKEYGLTILKSKVPILNLNVICR